jgi:hypothetical protein
MKPRSQVALNTCLLLTVLLLLSTGTGFTGASPGATLTLTYSFPALRLDIQSPTGVGSWQVEVDIPSMVTVGAATGSGFLTGASPLFSPPQYRWVNLQANGQNTGTLTIPVTYSGPYTITLTNVNLKDASNNIIALDTNLPIIVNIGSPNSISTNTTSSTTGSSSQTSSVITTMSLSTSSVTSSVVVSVVRTTTLLNLPESSGGTLAYVQVSSNSTLTGFQFDAARRVLNFTASGPIGSVGFTSVIMDKGFIDGPPMVLIDNGKTSLLSFFVTSNSTHYFIALTYPHSTHLISIGGANTLPEFQADLPQVVIALITVLFCLFLFQRRVSKPLLGGFRR